MASERGRLASSIKSISQELKRKTTIVPSISIHIYICHARAISVAYWIVLDLRKTELLPADRTPSSNDHWSVVFDVKDKVGLRPRLCAHFCRSQPETILWLLNHRGNAAGNLGLDRSPCCASNNLRQGCSELATRTS